MKHFFGIIIRLPLLFAILLLTAAILLACGPATVPTDNGPSVTPEPAVDTIEEATPTLFPTKPPALIPTHVPTKTPTPGPPPTLAPKPADPEGLEGCKSLGFFRDEGSADYKGWCSEQLAERVLNTCEGKPTTEEQRECGENLAREYGSYTFRTSPYRCAAVVEEQARLECMKGAGEDFEKAIGGLFETWAKIAIGGNQDPEVARATKDTMTCLEEQGFKNIDPYLLFTWQRIAPLQELKDREDRLSPEEKDLRERLLEPSRTCAKEHGLFLAQDEAWAAELRRLDKEEPATVTDVIREGLLEALEKPGIATIVSGEG